MTQSAYDLIAAVQSEMGTITSVRATGNEDMTENIPQTPLYEVYLEEGSGAKNSATSRNTFGGGIKLREWVIFVDCYVAKFAHIGQAYAALHRALADILEVLDRNTESDRPFNQEDTRIFSYTFKREIIPRGNNNYIGYRFRLQFTVL